MRPLLAAALLSAAALAGCDDGPGVCIGSLCGKGQCSPAAICTDACQKMIITAGTVCPAGYGCLGLNTCIEDGGGLRDFAGPRDLAAPLDLSASMDQSPPPADGDTDGSTD
jgi:hypothetical protein